MRKILITSLMLFTIGFCFGQMYDSIKFDTINGNTSVKDLFLNKIIAKDPINYQNENKTYSAVEAFEKFKQTRNATQYDLKIESNEKTKVVGKFYAIEMYIESDTIFKYDNLLFNRFSIYANLNDKAVAYKLYNDNQNESDLNKFIATCYSGNKDLSKDRKQSENHYFFDLNDRIIILKKINRNESSVMSISDSPPPPSIESSPVQSSELKNDTIESSISIELMVIFKNLTLDLKKYFEDANYLR
jgi:hypothetical protein